MESITYEVQVALFHANLKWVLLLGICSITLLLILWSKLISYGKCWGCKGGKRV